MRVGASSHGTSGAVCQGCECETRKNHRSHTCNKKNRTCRSREQSQALHARPAHADAHIHTHGSRPDILRLARFLACTHACTHHVRATATEVFVMLHSHAVDDALPFRIQCVAVRVPVYVSIGILIRTGCSPRMRRARGMCGARPCGERRIGLGRLDWPHTLGHGRWVRSGRAADRQL